MQNRTNSIDRDINSELDQARDQYESLVTTSKIMLVDDEPINTEVLQTYLESEGYHNFVTTSEPIHAIELIRAEKPDVILLDLMMPDVSGFDIMNAMRREQALPVSYTHLTLPTILLV